MKILWPILVFGTILVFTIWLGLAVYNDRVPLPLVLKGLSYPEAKDLSPFLFNCQIETMHCDPGMGFYFESTDRAQVVYEYYRSKLLSDGWKETINDFNGNKKASDNLIVGNISFKKVINFHLIEINLTQKNGYDTSSSANIVILQDGKYIEYRAMRDWIH